MTIYPDRHKRKNMTGENDDSIELKWEPPPPLGQSAKPQQIADALKARPGEWAVVREGNNINTMTSYAQLIREARSNSFLPVGSFEAVTRTANGQCRIYARYVGGDK